MGGKHMQRLVEYLKSIEASDLPDVPEHEDVYLHCDQHELISKIIRSADEVLIGADGTPLFEEMDRLWHDYGYFIFPGERDRFGWLTGCIQTKKGIIVFG
jgi:hypothetical protein